MQNLRACALIGITYPHRVWFEATGFEIPWSIRYSTLQKRQQPGFSTETLMSTLLQILRFLWTSISDLAFESCLTTIMDSLTRTLPASWFCSSALYQLERRAVFLKVSFSTRRDRWTDSQQSWHFLGPVTRFQKRAEKVRYEIAQVTVIVENISPENEGIDIDGITVFSEDEVWLLARMWIQTC